MPHTTKGPLSLRLTYAAIVAFPGIVTLLVFAAGASSWAVKLVGILLAIGFFSWSGAILAGRTRLGKAAL